MKPTEPERIIIETLRSITPAKVNGHQVSAIWLHVGMLDDDDFATFTIFANGENESGSSLKEATANLARRLNPAQNAAALRARAQELLARAEAIEVEAVK